MKSFESYLLQKTSTNTEIKNLQTGDKIKYIGKRWFAVKPNEIYTFIRLVKFSGELYIEVKEHNNLLINPKNIIKI